jgi:3-oxoacyl-ACP reductase-like protein
MSLLSNLMSKIFSHGSSTPPAASSSAPAPAAAAGTSTATQSAAPGAARPIAPPQPVDVAAVLDGLAAKNPEKLDWKHSIVDLMKLVGMDSSLTARKQLAAELHYTGNQSDTAAMNIWLQKQVLQNLAANGGKVPTELLK